MSTDTSAELVPAAAKRDKNYKSLLKAKTDRKKSPKGAKIFGETEAEAIYNNSMQRRIEEE